MSVPKISYSIAEAVTATGLSKSQLDRAIRARELKARRSSVDDDGNPVGKYVIRAEDLQAYIDSLPESA